MHERLFRVRGRVQGVGFRWWTRLTADRLGITGSVRNCSDGTVEVRARGDDQALSSFRQALRTGPPAAQVSRVDEEPAHDVPTDGFHVTG